MKIMSSMNKIQNKKRMYGYDMNDSSMQFVSNDYSSPDQLGRLEITGIKIERSSNNFDLIRIEYTDGGRTKEILEESLYHRNDEELERENLLLATYKDVASKKDVKEIKCADFLDEIYKRLKADVRYA